MEDNIKGDRLSLVQFGTEPYPNDVLLNFQNVYTSEKMMVVISKKEFYMPSGTHSHSDYEFYFPFVEGQPHIFGSKTIVLNKNRVVPINPFLAHGLAREVPRFSAMDIMMNKDYVEDLSMSVFGHRQIEFECNEYKVSPELENLIRLFIDESKHVQSGTSFAQQCLAMLIVINFFRCFRSNRSFPPVERNYRESEGIKRVIEYMNDEHCSDYSFKVNGRPINYLTITHYGYEPDFAPAGHTLITCSINQFHADYDAWNALAEDPSAYSREKTRIGKEVIAGIEKRFPQMSGKLNLLDVATPKTFERYCNAYRGAFMPFLPTIKGKMMAHTGRIKGLENIFLSGQWLQPPGGLPVALITGKDTIMRLCKMKNKLFVY